jgi:uncharacterized protein
MARLSYLELPVRDTTVARQFYTSVFGWTFTAFGPTYAATTSGDTDVGFQADAAEQTGAALPIVQVDDIDATLRDVESADGEITKPIFAFPGGRRFHFRDPDGHELAVMQPG